MLQIIRTFTNCLKIVNNSVFSFVPIFKNVSRDRSKISILFFSFRYYWKMIIDESLNLGVVIIGVNNPFLSESEGEDYKKLCPSIPDHPLFDNIYYPDDIEKGIMYACSVADAQKSIHEIPKEVTVTGVLY